MLVWHNCHVGILQLGPMKVSTVVTAPGEKAYTTEQAIKQKTINRAQWWLVEMTFKTNNNNNNKTLFMSLWFKKKNIYTKLLLLCQLKPSTIHLLFKTQASHQHYTKQTATRLRKNVQGQR